MDKIPIVFECEGTNYIGVLSKTSGAANSSTYYLMIDNFYCGQLCINAYGWAFYGTPKTKHFEPLGKYFANYVTEWLE